MRETRPAGSGTPQPRVIIGCASCIVGRHADRCGRHPFDYRTSARRLARRVGATNRRLSALCHLAARRSVGSGSGATNRLLSPFSPGCAKALARASGAANRVHLRVPDAIAGGRPTTARVASPATADRGTGARCQRLRFARTASRPIATMMRILPYRTPINNRERDDSHANATGGDTALSAWCRSARHRAPGPRPPSRVAADAWSALGRRPWPYRVPAGRADGGLRSPAAHAAAPRRSRPRRACPRSSRRAPPNGTRRPCSGIPKPRAKRAICGKTARSAAVGLLTSMARVPSPRFRSSNMIRLNVFTAALALRHRAARGRPDQVGHADRLPGHQFPHREHPAIRRRRRQGHRRQAQDHGARQRVAVQGARDQARRAGRTGADRRDPARQLRERGSALRPRRHSVPRDVLRRFARSSTRRRARRSTTSSRSRA